MRSPATPESTIDPADDGLRFRGASLGEAVAAAEESVGGKVKVLEANKIRRGGIGGFFASDLGVEVTVVPEDGSVDDVLERLMAATADDRSFERSITAELEALVAATEEDDDEYVLDTTEVSMRDLRKMVDLTATVTPRPPRRSTDASAPASAAEAIAAHVADTAPRASRKLQPPAEMVSARDIVAELAALTAPRGSIRGVGEAGAPGSAADLDETVTTSDAAIAPTKKRLVSPGKLVSDAPPAPPAPVVVATSPAPVTVPVPVPVIESRTEVVMSPVAAPVALVAPLAARSPEVVPASAVDVIAPQRPRPAGAPSRRHVELTLAAADQLIDSLSRTGNVQRLSVRVALRSGDQREVEVEAQWEAAPSAVTAVPATATGI